MRKLTVVADAVDRCVRRRHVGLVAASVVVGGRRQRRRQWRDHGPRRRRAETGRWRTQPGRRRRRVREPGGRSGKDGVIREAGTEPGRRVAAAGCRQRGGGEREDVRGWQLETAGHQRLKKLLLEQKHTNNHTLSEIEACLLYTSDAADE